MSVAVQAGKSGGADQSDGPWLLSAKGELVSAVVAAGLLIAGFILRASFDDARPAHLAGHGCDFAALGIGLFHGGRAAWHAVRGGRFDIDVLMIVGAVLAAFIGAPSEGALLLMLFTLSGALEELAMQRTTRAVEALHKLMPTSALKWTGTAWEHVEPELLVVGDRVRILPGELAPVDCRVTMGSSSMNQANLTGESMPRDVGPGDDLYAGTVNVGSPMEATVSKPASQSSLQKILDLVTSAQQQREPVQQVIDRVSQPYAIGVFAAAIATFVVFWLALDRTASSAAYTAITLLIVASPCALVIATPTATLAGISRAARGGVLFKGGAAISRLAGLQAVAFDKTGTLTIGKPRVVRVEVVGVASEQTMLAVAAGLEEHSTHPIAQAIIDAAKAAGATASAVSEVGYIAGRGVTANIDAKPARLGSLAHTREMIPEALQARVGEVLKTIQSGGHIGVVCVYEGSAAVFILSDSARPGAECLVRRLHEQGVKPVVMLTGDNRATAQRVADDLGIDEVHADLLPGDKVDQVKRLKAAGTSKRFVGVIGDGVNDAPALAAADVSMAIGSIGSDAALESADIVLLSDDLSTVPWAVGIARRTRRTIVINLSFALGAMGVMAIAVLIAAGMGIKVPLWMGVVGHEGGTLLVVAHSLLLLTLGGIPVCTCQGDGHVHTQESAASNQLPVAV